MDIPGLNKEIARMLESDLSNSSYSELSDDLQSRGFNQQERVYIMNALEEKVLIPQAEAKIKPNFRFKISVGIILCVLSLLTVGSLYFGQQTTREIYYVALAVFALGYYILRSGLKERSAD